MRDHGIFLFSPSLFLLLWNKRLGHGVASRSFKSVPEGSIPEVLKVLYSSSLIGRWHRRKGQSGHRAPQIRLQFPHWPTSMGFGEWVCMCYGNSEKGSPNWDLRGRAWKRAKEGSSENVTNLLRIRGRKEMNQRKRQEKGVTSMGSSTAEAQETVRMSGRS